MVTDSSPFGKHCQILIDMIEEIECPLILVDAHAQGVEKTSKVKKQVRSFKTTHKGTNWMKVYKVFKIKKSQMPCDKSNHDFGHEAQRRRRKDACWCC